jgi:two-component system chemotaxis response regulator CheB
MENRDILVVGASAGGVEALSRLCGALPADLPAAVLVVLHTSPQGPSLLARLLGRVSALPVHAAEEGMPLEAGRIYVSVPDRHLLLRKGHLLVRRGPYENRTRPAVNALFRSAAVAYGSRVIGLVLTGALDDGTDGLIAIKRAGGLSVVQSPDDAAWPSMPQQALLRDHVDHALPLSQLPELLSRLVRTPAGESFPLPESMRAEDQIAAEEAPMLSQEIQPPGTPSPMTCPDCGGVLNEIGDQDTLRFRCQIGHAYSVLGLDAAQSEEVEHGLQIAIRTHRERLALFMRMRDSARQRGHNHAEIRWSAAVKEAAALAAALEKTLSLLATSSNDSEPSGRSSPGPKLPSTNGGSTGSRA